LFDNDQFENRIAIIAECNKCYDNILLLIEERKYDGKIFHDLKVGEKARKAIARCSNEINYTQEDIKENKVPFGWKYGKSVKLKNGYRILRSDFKGNVETIGYIHNKGKNIISEEEYEKLSKT
jgi:hypothetical protein